MRGSFFDIEKAALYNKALLFRIEGDPTACRVAHLLTTLMLEEHVL
jgi:hypothetical protein